MAENKNVPVFIHKSVVAKGIPIHVVEAGQATEPAILFIHGWPTNWREFSPVMQMLSDEYHVIAVDIPGIGESKVPVQSYSKQNIAIYILALIEAMNLRDVTLVGCDCGGQIVYACLKISPDCVSHAVIMNVVIPGVEPWNEVKNNPYIWHFKFHLVPELPEKLVSGRELEYFSYFYNVLAGKGNRISDEYRAWFSRAYSNLDALKAGFDLYRCFQTDENDNIQLKNVPVPMPVLYLRGGDEPVNIETYEEGFKENGIENIETAIIEHCGHFSAIEQPEEVALMIRKFIKR